MNDNFVFLRGFGYTPDELINEHPVVSAKDSKKKMVKGVLTLRKPTMLSSTVPDNIRRTDSRHKCY